MAPTMEFEAQEIMGEVDAVMGVMEGYPDSHSEAKSWLGKKVPRRD